MNNAETESKEAAPKLTPDGEGLAGATGYALRYTPQWQEALGWKLFPNSYTDMPELPEMKDCLHCCVVVHLGWLDRLRMLVSGRLDVTAKTATENVIGKCLTNSGVSVRPPAWLDRRNR